MELFAVFTHETRKYFMFQLLEKEKRVVGTIYFRKDTPLPENLDFAVITPNDERWKCDMDILVNRSRVGSKGRNKLWRSIRENADGGPNLIREEKSSHES